MYFLIEAAMKTSESGCDLCFSSYMRKLSSWLGSQKEAWPGLVCPSILTEAPAAPLPSKKVQFSLPHPFGQKGNNTVMLQGFLFPADCGFHGSALWTSKSPVSQVCVNMIENMKGKVLLRHNKKAITGHHCVLDQGWCL